MAAEHIGFEVGQRRRLASRAHVRPDNPAAFFARVRNGFDFALEVRLGGLIGHVHARAVGRELPPVVDASEAGLLVAAEEETAPAVRAVVLDQADRAVGGTEADQVLAEQFDPQWRAVGLGKLIGADGWQPVLAHEVAHGRARPDAAQILVLGWTQHDPTMVAPVATLTRLW